MIARSRPARGGRRVTGTSGLKGIGLDTFEIAISVPLFLEYEDVLSRPPFLRRTGLPIKDIDQVLIMLAMKGYDAPFHFMWRPQLRDSNDEMVLETATNGGTTAIVTFNRRDFLPAAADLAIKILTPAVFLKYIDRSLSRVNMLCVPPILCLSAHRKSQNRTIPPSINFSSLRSQRNSRRWIPSNCVLPNAPNGRIRRPIARSCRASRIARSSMKAIASYPVHADGNHGSGRFMTSILRRIIRRRMAKQIEICPDLLRLSCSILQVIVSAMMCGFEVVSWHHKPL